MKRKSGRGWTTTALATAAAIVLLVPSTPAAADPCCANAPWLPASDQPLSDRVPKTMPAPPPGGAGFTYRTNSPMWSAVAIQPDSSHDVDLSLRDDSSILATSVKGTGTTDFVAVDSNRRPLQNYRAVVTPYIATAPYIIEMAQGDDPVPVPVSWSSTFVLTSPHILQVHDVAVTTGQCLEIRAWGTTHNTGTLYLLGGDPAATVQGPTTAVAQVSFRPGEFPDYYDSVGFTYKAPHSENLGLVVVNRNDGSATAPLQYEVVPATTC